MAIPEQMAIPPAPDEHVLAPETPPRIITAREALDSTFGMLGMLSPEVYVIANTPLTEQGCRRACCCCLIYSDEYGYVDPSRSKQCMTHRLWLSPRLFDNTGLAMQAMQQATRTDHLSAHAVYPAAQATSDDGSEEECEPTQPYPPAPMSAPASLAPSAHAVYPAAQATSDDGSKEEYEPTQPYPPAPMSAPASLSPTALTSQDRPCLKRKRGNAADEADDADAPSSQRVKNLPTNRELEF